MMLESSQMDSEVFFKYFLFKNYFGTKRKVSSLKDSVRDRFLKIYYLELPKNLGSDSITILSRIFVHLFFSKHFLAFLF